MRIFRRGNTWYTDFNYQGVRDRKAVGDSKRQAELRLKEIEFKIARGEDPRRIEPPATHFCDYTEEYLRFCKISKTRGTWERDILSAKHLTAFFDDDYLTAITARKIDRYRARRLEEDGVKNATVNREIACLRHMFNKAIEWGYVDESPVKGIKMLNEPPGRVRYLEHEDIDRLLKECAPYLRSIAIAALNTGLRESELLRLKWSDVNLRTGTLTVHKTKTNERRFVPVNDILARELSRLHAQRRSDFVFCDDGGKPFKRVYRGFKAACKRAGIEDFTFHDLRHTFASHLVLSDVPIRTVQELMGHKTIKMTMRYAHLSNEHLQDAVGKLNLGSSSENQKYVRRHDPIDTKGEVTQQNIKHMQGIS